jgi:signal transduction histidine kinase
VDALLRLRAMDKGLAFNLVLEYPLPKIIHTDTTRLSQILLNLLNNAVKFTQEGTVSLNVSAAEGHLVFRVHDTGIGIDKNQAKNLFSAFAQADNSTTRLYGGTGLGLFVSKNIAQLLGGDITLQSAVGVGSAFTVTLPCQTGAEFIHNEAAFAVLWAEQSRQHATQVLPKLSGKILVAEDNSENQRLAPIKCTL